MSAKICLFPEFKISLLLLTTNISILPFMFKIYRLVEHQSTKQTFKLTVKQGDRQFSFKTVKNQEKVGHQPKSQTRKQKKQKTENTERPFS
jgi:hypothetical protein